MPEKDGDEDKSTKSVVKKKQKQMMGEEGYDIARDMGRVRPSKDKKDATTMPQSKKSKRKEVKGDTPMQKEFKKKYGKKATALDAVKQEYKGQIMKVEELDLTKVAEAFGGYIVEAPLKSLTGDPEEIEKRIKKGAAEVTGQRKEKGAKALAKAAGIKLATQGPEQAAATQAFKDMRMSGDRKFSDLTPDTKTGMRATAAGKGRSEPDDEMMASSGGKKKGEFKAPSLSPTSGGRKIRKKMSPSQKESELEGKRKDYLDPKTNKASPEGVKKYITKARQMRSGSNVPVDQETTDNIAKIAGKEYEDKINQKYGGRRAGKRKSTATPPAFATRTGESGGPLPVSMRNRRVPKTSSLSTPVTTTPTFKSFQDKVKEVTPEIVKDTEYTQQTIPGMGSTPVKSGETVNTVTRGFKPDPKFIKPPKGFNPDQLELPFGKDQRQVYKPPSDMLDKILNRNRRRSKGENEVKDYMDKFRTPPEKEIKGLISPSKTKGLIGTGRTKPVDVTDLRTQPEGGDGGKKPPIVTTGTGASGDRPRKKSSPLEKAREFARQDPVAALAGYDIGKGILGKIMKTRIPTVPTPRAIRVSAKS